MGLSTMNGRDQNPYQQHLDKPYEPVAMPLGKHIDKHIKKLEDIENIDQLLILVVNMCALLGSQGKIVSRQALVDLIPSIKAKTKISAATWNSHFVYALAGIGAAVSIVTGVTSAFQTFQVLQKMPALQAAAFTDIGQQTVQLQIQNMLNRASSISSTGSGVSQACKAAEEIKKGHLTGERQEIDLEIDLKRNKREHLQQTSGSQGQKSDESMSMSQRLIDELHREKGAAR